MKKALMLAMMVLMLMPGTAGAEVIDGVKFGLEKGIFYFLNTTWGMSREQVRKALQQISDLPNSTPVLDLLEPGKGQRDLRFNVRGRLVERDGFDFICIGNDNNEVVFHFEFENNRLSAIYIKNFVLNVEINIQILVMIGMSKHSKRVRTIEDNGSKLMIIKEKNHNIAYPSAYKTVSAPAFSVWSPSTKMTLERILNNSAEIFELYKPQTSLTSNSEKTMPTRPPDNFRLDFYQRNVLELLN